MNGIVIPAVARTSIFVHEDGTVIAGTKNKAAAAGAVNLLIKPFELCTGRFSGFRFSAFLLLCLPAKFTLLKEFIAFTCMSCLQFIIRLY